MSWNSASGKDGRLDDLRQGGQVFPKVFRQAFQGDEGGVIAGAARQTGAPGLDVLGQLQLAAGGGAQGEEFRGPIGHPGFARGVGLGAPLGHEGETQPGSPGEFHPQELHAVGEGGLVDFGDVVCHFWSLISLWNGWFAGSGIVSSNYL